MNEKNLSGDGYSLVVKEEVKGTAGCGCVQ